VLDSPKEARDLLLSLALFYVVSAENPSRCHHSIPTRYKT